jgi:hypothetical protein
MWICDHVVMYITCFRHSCYGYNRHCPGYVGDIVIYITSTESGMLLEFFCRFVIKIDMCITSDYLTSWCVRHVVMYITCIDIPSVQD